MGLAGLKGPPGSFPSDSNDDWMERRSGVGAFFTDLRFVGHFRGYPTRWLQVGHQPKY